MTEQIKLLNSLIYPQPLFIFWSGSRWIWNLILRNWVGVIGMPSITGHYALVISVSSNASGTPLRGNSTQYHQRASSSKFLDTLELSLLFGFGFGCYLVCNKPPCNCPKTCVVGSLTSLYCPYWINKCVSVGAIVHWFAPRLHVTLCMIIDTKMGRWLNGSYLKVNKLSSSWSWAYQMSIRFSSFICDSFENWKFSDVQFSVFSKLKYIEYSGAIH